ncbi:MAG: hypothetical protein Q4D40_07455 [Eubacteriales bacterium]|nr:hypothetical protein [Eubacteriales bacterium]
MKKQTKIAVGVAAGALLAVGASVTSLAATGWVNEDGNWYYYNSSGDRVANEWKSYNGQYFYLGDDEAMVTNQLIDDSNGNYYYVDANGAMVKNTWVAVPADEDEELDVEYRWYYFGSTGKAYKSSYGKVINGKQYGFDDEGKMLFGYVEDESYNIINDEDDPILRATYYFGTNDDGARHSGWLQYTDAFTDDSYDEDSYWFYFNTNGKKASGTTKNINGKKYSFNEDGVMNYKFTLATVADEATVTWWGSADDGSLAKSQWIWAVPTEDQNADDYSNDEYRWFRTDASGRLIKNQTKKINSKWYVFDEAGIMKSGFVLLSSPAVSNATFVAALDSDEVGSGDIMALQETYPELEAGSLHYFADSQSDGSMKTGTIKIEIADDIYTFGFTKTTGAAKHGVVDKKIYNNGILLKADDEKYKVVTDPTTGIEYVVGSTGTIVTGTSKYKNSDDVYLVANSGKYVASFTDSAEADEKIKEIKAGS